MVTKEDSGAGDFEAEQIEESRRKFMKAAGKVAIYTPPAMLLIMQPNLQAFAKSGGGGGHRSSGGDGGGGHHRRRRRSWHRRD